MSETILFVDDERFVLAALRRCLRKRYTIRTSIKGTEALEFLADDSSIAVVVSDLAMPEMVGTDFLARAREIRPDVIRVMLTGHADIKSSLDAVNKGQIFRFLLKPCSTADMCSTLDTCLDQHRLEQSERRLLEKTLSGAINLLAEVYTLSSQGNYGTSTVVQYVNEQLASLGIPMWWQLKLAANLCRIGYIGLPKGLIDKLLRQERLSAQEKQLYRQHPKIAGQLISKIPRLEEVAMLVTHHLQRVDLRGQSPDPKTWSQSLL